MRVPALVCLFACALAAPSAAQDGQAIMRRMGAAYTRLEGYSYTLNATMVTARGQTQAVSGTRTIVRFSRPNRLYLQSTTPNIEVGTFTAASDGKQNLIHVAKYNVFQRQPAPANAAGLLRALQPYGVGTIVNLPLQLLRGPLPAGRITRPVRGADVVVNGAACYSVTATYRHPSVANGAPGKITLAISRRDHLLRRAVVRYTRVPATVEDAVVDAGGLSVKPVRGHIDVTMAEFVSSPQANGAFGPGDFTFTLPPGATEIPPRKPGEVLR